MTHFRLKPRQTKKGTRYHIFRVEADGSSTSVWSGTSKDEAKTTLTKLRKTHQLDRAGILEKNPALGQVIDAYLAYLEGKPSHASVASHFNAHVDDEMRAIKVSRLDKSVIDEWVEAMRAKGRKPQTVNHGLKNLKAAINRATPRLWAGPNPVAGYPMQHIGDTVLDIVEPDEVERALPHFAAIDRCLVALAYETCCRAGELLGLEKLDVDRARQTATVRKSHDRGTKTGDVRLVPLTTRAMRWVNEAWELSGDSPYLLPWHDGDRQPEDRKLADMFRAGLARAGMVKGWMLKCRRRRCINEHGKQFTRVVEAYAGDERCPRCNMLLWPAPIHRDVTFKALRNAGATRLWSDGVSELTLRKLMGHHAFELLLRRYLQMTPERMLEDLERADRTRRDRHQAATKLRRVK